MKSLENIWEKGKHTGDHENSLNTDHIIKAISESSIGITSGLRKPIWFGIGLSSITCLALISNLFFYTTNLPIQMTITGGILAAVFVLIYLLRQNRTLKTMDTRDISMQEILIYKINYLNIRYHTAIHLVSFSIVLATFTINLSMEASDGVFEGYKILILSAVYLISYIVTFSLFKLSLKAYNLQLKNALQNLEENSLNTLDEELKKYKRSGRVILFIVASFFLFGIAALLFFS